MYWPIIWVTISNQWHCPQCPLSLSRLLSVALCAESTLPNIRVPAITRSRIGRGDVGSRHWKRVVEGRDCVRYGASLLLEKDEEGNMEEKNKTKLAAFSLSVCGQEQASFRTGSRTIASGSEWSWGMEVEERGAMHQTGMGELRVMRG